MTAGFLEEPFISPEAQALYDEDVKESGYVWNVSHLWAYQPDTQGHLFELMSMAFKPSGLNFRRARNPGDGGRVDPRRFLLLAGLGRQTLGVADPSLVAGVLSGTDVGLTAQERAIASWARKVVKDPNSTTPGDIQELRDDRADGPPESLPYGLRRPPDGVLHDQRRPRSQPRHPTG